jgi:hypothetical protein
MKRTFLAMALLAGSCAVFAQTDTTTNTTTNTTNMDNNTMSNNSSNMNSTNSTTTNSNMTSSGSYNAYATAPSNVQMYFTRDYPAASNVTWQQATNIWNQGNAAMNTSNYWVATYNTAGRFNRVYYDYAGNHYLVALPVTSTWVPDDIVNKVGSLYGANIYDITSLKGANGQTVYQVRVLDNGQSRTEWIDDAGNKVTEYYRTDDMNNGTTNDMNNSNMNNSNMNNSNMNNSNMNNMNNSNTNSSTNTDVNTNTTTTTTNDMNTSNQGTIKTKTKREGDKTKTKTKRLPATDINSSNQ